MMDDFAEEIGAPERPTDSRIARQEATGLRSRMIDHSMKHGLKERGHGIAEHQSGKHMQKNRH